MFTFRGNIAEKFGLNAAVVAEYLYIERNTLEKMDLAGKTWCRCSAKKITIDNPFLTVDMARHALSILRNNGIIRSEKLSKSDYDHTNWYCFTEYGENLMNGGE